MSGVKTAISLDEELFHEVEIMAQQMKVSRSRLFVMAIRDFLKKRENQDLLEKLNAAYSDTQSDEQKIAKNMKKGQASLLEQEPW